MLTAVAQFNRAVNTTLDKYATRTDVQDVAIIVTNLTGVQISEWNIDLAHSNLTSVIADDEL